MKIITFVSRKGGVGKSTLTCLLALYWAHQKRKRTAIKDYDAQGSSQAFVNLIQHPNIAPYQGGEDFDFLLIDTPGGAFAPAYAGLNQKDLNELVNLSNLVIVTLCLSPTDIRSSAETARLINAQDKTRLLFNQVDARTSAFKDRETTTTGFPTTTVKQGSSSTLGIAAQGTLTLAIYF